MCNDFFDIPSAINVFYTIKVPGPKSRPKLIPTDLNRIGIILRWGNVKKSVYSATMSSYKFLFVSILNLFPWFLTTFFDYGLFETENKRIFVKNASFKCGLQCNNELVQVFCSVNFKFVSVVFDQIFRLRTSRNRNQTDFCEKTPLLKAASNLACNPTHYLMNIFLEYVQK